MRMQVKYRRFDNDSDFADSVEVLGRRLRGICSVDMGNNHDNRIATFGGDDGELEAVIPALAEAGFEVVAVRAIGKRLAIAA